MLHHVANLVLPDFTLQIMTEPAAPSSPANARRPEDSPTLLIMSLLGRLGGVGWGFFNSIGLLWVGHPTPGMVAAWLAMVAACIPANRPSLNEGTASGARRSLLIFILAVCAIVLQCVDVAWYYLYQAIPGNYYPWITTLLAFGIFALLAMVGWVTRAFTLAARA